MTAFHIVQGGVDNGDTARIEKAARTGKSVGPWTVPKHAVAGDEVAVYVPGFGFLATATIKHLPKPRADWPNRYGSLLTAIRIINPAISLAAIRRHVPSLTWANYPRSITTPEPEISDRLRKLIENGRKTGIPDERSLAGASLDELRRIALLAELPSVAPKVRKAIFRVRSLAIKFYVLRRAKGVCESCAKPAPFRSANGSPFLEPHHTRRLADDGPDHPAHVIALCPNCHRRAHYSRDATAFNSGLIRALKRIERDV